MAWDRVTPTTVANCFGKCGFFGSPEEVPPEPEDPTIEDWEQLNVECASDDFCTADDNLATCGARTVEDIVEEATCGAADSSDDGDDIDVGDGEGPPPAAETLHALGVLRRAVAADEARRLEALTAGAKGLMLDDDLEKTEQERMDIFYNYVKAHKAAGALDGKEVVGEAERLEVRDKAPLVLCELLFDENILSQVAGQRALLLRFTHGNHRAQRYLLGGIEQVVKEYSAALLPRVPHLLKLLYDQDIVEEEVLLDWSKRVSKKYVSREVAQEIHERARPFIKWLQEAEEEESSSEGDGDDSQDENVEVVYSDRHISTSIQEDDIDIDAI
ncbi:hypothetical protein MRX96_044683 [Rhipicephalus microplus]